MPAPSPSRFPPGRLIALLNSVGLGAVTSAAKLRRFREEAGAAICGMDPAGLPDFGSVHLLRFTAWLVMRRHRRPGPAAAAGPKRRGPRFTGKGPAF